MSKVKAVRRVEKNAEERQAIIGMVVDDRYLQQIHPITNLDYFKAPFARAVAEWCLSYWESFSEAPKRQIEDVFEAKKREGRLDEDVSDIIESFLSSLSDEYEDSDKRSTEYLLKATETYYKKRSLEILREDLGRCLLNGDVSLAEETLNSFKKPERENSIYSNPFNDEDLIRDSFEHSVTPLFKLPGVLGEFLNDLFVRDSLVAIMGPEKRGKTWNLMHLSKMALSARNNVAFFAVGDMTMPQMTVRYHIMHNRLSNKKKYCGDLLIPILDCKKNQDGSCEDREGEAIKEPPGFDFDPEHIVCTSCNRDQKRRREFQGAVWWKRRLACDPLDWRTSLKEGERYMEKIVKGKHFRLSCHANSSINIKGIINLLDQWEMTDGFVPDVILIDYADILDKEDHRDDSRGSENSRWKALRSLSQQKNCLVITATQADASSYKMETLSESNFSEDKRKYSHANGFITLNQTKDEKKQGLMRIGKMFVREDDFDSNQTVKVLQNLQTGQTAIASYY